MKLPPFVARARRAMLCAALVLSAAALGGGCLRPFVGPAPAPTASHPFVPEANPVLLPAVNREFLWEQLVDTVDNYFVIEREDRVRLTGDVLTQGRIETYYTTGSTLLEPWRGDSTPPFERLHSTLQSVRRKATVQVTPQPEGHLVNVTVIKELEVLARPERATAGGVTVRHDNSLRSEERLFDEDRAHSVGWIRLGRDVDLEQRIIAELRARVTLPADSSLWSVPQ